jgi:hypothetical protein
VLPQPREYDDVGSVSEAQGKPAECGNLLVMACSRSSINDLVSELRISDFIIVPPFG